MKIKNKTRGFSQLYWVIADKLDKNSLTVYYFLKSMTGYDQIDVSQNQIAKATGLSKGSVNKALKILEKKKVIYREKGKGFNGSDVIVMNDEELASKLDPDFSYNTTRPKIWKLKKAS